MLPLQARAAGQSTACPKLYNLQTLGKLGTGASNPELWGFDDGEGAKTMMQALLVAMIWWKLRRSRCKTLICDRAERSIRLPSWAFNNFDLFTALANWCQCHRSCDHSFPVPVDLLAAKCLSTPPRPFLHPTHVRHLGCGCCDIVMVWLVLHTMWCLVLDHSGNSLGRAVTSIVSGLLHLISISRCDYMLWYVCTGHGEPRLRASNAFRHNHSKHHTKATEVAVFRVANCEELPPKPMCMEYYGMKRNWSSSIPPPHVQKQHMWPISH